MTGKVTASAHRHGLDPPGSPSYTAKKSTRIIQTVRRESARKRVPREAYLVSRIRRYRHTHSVLRFTLHERRFTRTRSGLAIAAETFMNNAG